LVAKTLVGPAIPLRRFQYFDLCDVDELAPHHLIKPTLHELPEPGVQRRDAPDIIERELAVRRRPGLTYHQRKDAALPIVQQPPNSTPLETYNDQPGDNEE
jgi:hypothetical protein